MEGQAMEKEFRILVFGKTGCQKCDMLKRRLDKMLTEEAWQGFEKQYCDLGTVDGLVSFCKSECLNPSRIPAMLVTRRNPASGEFEPVENPTPGVKDEICGKSRLYQYVGLQTDYSDTGKGVITPRMITCVLEQARAVNQ